jgi:hypothetical protein
MATGKDLFIIGGSGDLDRLPGELDQQCYGRDRPWLIAQLT